MEEIDIFETEQLKIIGFKWFVDHLAWFAEIMHTVVCGYHAVGERVFSEVTNSFYFFSTSMNLMKIEQDS